MKTFKKHYEANKNVISNFSSLSIIQLVNLLLPFIIMPFLIDALGSYNYGLVIFVQVMVSYFSVFINFGFDISATKQISLNRYIPDGLSRVFTSVIFAKSFLFLCCIPFLLILYFYIPALSVNKKLFLFSSMILLVEVLNPICFFQGIEKMNYLTYINLLSKSISTILIFAFINSESDYFLVPLMFNSAGIIGNSLGVIIIWKIEKVHFTAVSKGAIYEEIMRSFPFFFSKASSLILTKTNNLILGFYVGYSSVAFYDVAEKIVGALIIPFNMLNQAIFPGVSVSKDMKFLKKIIILSFVVSIVVYLILIGFSDIILQFLGGNEFVEQKNVLYVFGITIIIVNLIYLLSTSLIIHGFIKQYSFAIIISMIIYLLMLAFLIQINLLSIENLIFLKVGSDMCSLLYLVYINKKKLNHKDEI